ncbi:MAG TPA: FAD binding domain-containing protein [Bryobacteraceae bacterium]|nr:FAD binding domain-containing protein [Bryobacteraceae bacterium]
MTSPGASLQFLLNGNLVSVERTSLQATLLDFLRERALTGAKEGCAEGECGACTVVLVGPDGDCSSAYRAVNSCLMFLPAAAGHEIYTVESLAAGGRLAPAQAAMAAAGGSQCGYCTPGFVMSLFAEQYRRGRSGGCDPHALASNLCRCTGYRPIRDAALSLGPAPEGAFKDRLSRPAPLLEPVSYANGEARFSRPASIRDCVAILSADPGARLLAGGTDLAVESNLRGRRWSHLVSLEGIAELREFAETAGCVRIGSALSLNEIAERWRDAPEAFREWLPLFASPALRNRATLGGNFATASPIGDGAPLFAALDANLQVAGPGGRRSVPLAAFFTSYRRTALEPGQLITGIEIPKPLPQHARFYKVAKRRMDDISTVAAGLALDWNSAGRIVRARFVFGGVAPVPLRVQAAEEAVIGERWNESAVSRVQSILARTLKPISDHRGSSEYRLALAQSLIEKFWWERREVAA